MDKKIGERMDMNKLEDKQMFCQICKKIVVPDLEQHCPIT